MAYSITLVGFNIGIWIHNLVTVLVGNIPHA